MSGPRVGVMLPTFRDSPDDALRIAAEAEELGIDGVFVYDHLWPMGRPDRPALSPFPVLGAIAARSARLWLGTLVARVGVVPDEVLIAEFATLAHLAPGRVVAGLGTGDRLSFNENRAYGVALDSAADRRAEVGECARALLDRGLTVWIGGTSAATVAVAESVGAVPNFWQVPPGRIAAQAIRSEVSWAGMAAPADGAGLDASALLVVARPLAEAGATWLVFGWPVALAELAAAARDLRAG